MALHPSRRRLPEMVYLALMFVGAAGVGLGAWAPGAQSLHLDPDELTTTKAPFTPFTILRSNADLVEMVVTVRDPTGRPVGNLNRDNFHIFDQDKPQSMLAFEADEHRLSASMAAPGASGSAAAVSVPAATQSLRPRYVLIFFDNLNTDAAGLASAVAAARRYLHEDLRQTDLISIATTESLTQFSGSVPEAEAKLDKIAPRNRSNDVSGCPLIRPQQAYEIINNLDPDALDLAASQAILCNCTASALSTTLPNGAKTGFNPGSGISESSDAMCNRNMVELVKHKSEMVWDQAKVQYADTLGVLRALVDYLSKQDGDRTLLLTSSGFLNIALQQEQDRVLNEALRGNVVINSLDTNGIDAGPSGSRSPEGPDNPLLPDRPELNAFREQLDHREISERSDVLADLAEDTGGVFFQNSNDLTKGIKELAGGAEYSYRIGFQPKGLIDDGAYHKLKVEVDGAGPVTVEARKGYYAPAKPVEADTGAAQRQSMLQEIYATGERTELGLRLAVQPGTLNDHSAVDIADWLDMSTFPFVRVNDRSTANLVYVACLFTAGGQFVAGEQGDVAFHLKDSSRQDLPSLRWSLSLSAPAGDYRLREVVLETQSGRMASFTRAVHLN